MIIPNIKQIEKMANDYSLIPICKEIYGDIITPITLLKKISKRSQKYFLFESAEVGERWARYSFLGFDPIMHISCKNNELIIKGKNKQHLHTDKPFDFLRKLMSQYKAPKMQGMPPFSGGLVGTFSYEMIRYAEKDLRLKDNEMKDFDLMFFDKVIAYDHLQQKMIIIVNMKTDQVDKNYKKALSDIEEIIKIFIPENEEKELDKGIESEKEKIDLLKVEFISRPNKKEFCEMVERVKEHIAKGDILQGVISRRFEAEYKDSLLNAYQVLRTINPSSYMVFLRNEDTEIISASPETLVSLQDGIVRTFPIAASRPRGQTREEDLLLEQELLADDKELSEHNMLVDLAKEELEKLSEANSVKIKDYMKIERFSKIMHITSLVEGRIKSKYDGFHAIERIIPAGTLSGYPKAKACQIIDNLETIPRGIYGGAIGYIDFTGNMDTCIAIRMAIKNNNRVYVQAGSGIVAESIGEKEYEESGNKAKALIEAIQRAGKVEEI